MKVLKYLKNYTYMSVSISHAWERRPHYDCLFTQILKFQMKVVMLSVLISSSHIPYLNRIFSILLEACIITGNCGSVYIFCVCIFKNLYMNVYYQNCLLFASQCTHYIYIFSYIFKNISDI